MKPDRRTYVVCGHCGESFVRLIKTQIYCNKDCASEHRAAKSEAKRPNCIMCGKPVTRWGKEFCSIACRSKGPYAYKTKGHYNATNTGCIDPGIEPSHPDHTR